MRIEDLVDLRPVILAARQVRDERNTLRDFLPAQPVEDVSYRLGRAQRLDQTVPIRAFDQPAIPIRRPGIVAVRGDLPAITPLELLTETDLNRAYRLAGLPVQAAPQVSAAAFRTAVTVDNTLELMRGQVLSTGVISIAADDGPPMSVDFGIPAGNKFGAATAWTSSAAPILADLEAWHEQYIESAGGPAGAILTSSRVVGLMLQNDQMRQALGTGLIIRETLDQVLAGRGLPPIRTYDRSLQTESGKVRVFPNNRLVLLPAPDSTRVGTTQLGITQEAVQQVERQVLAAGAAPGITVVTLVNDDPVQRAVKAAAVALPVIDDPESIVTATVAA